MILTNLSPETKAGASADTSGAQPHPEPVADADFARRIEGEASFLRRAARRWHREPADAEDLVQDTIVQALANAHQWQPGTDLRGWLYTIMRNRFFAGVTRSNRSNSALEQIARVDLRPATEACELRLVMRDLLAALRRLPSNQRSAVLLIGVEGKSYGEAAETMGTSVGAVRSHLARGRERLRTAVHGSDTRPPFSSRSADGSPVSPCPQPARSEAAD
jgi:RNA polymerase sigma-70 factor, ECF subfamily